MRRGKDRPCPPRADGRADDELRPITLTRGWLDHAAGSVLVEFGKTPRAEVDRLKKWGFDLAIYPGLGFSVAAEAMRQAWSHLKDKGTSNGVAAPQYRDMHELMGFADVWDFEKRWAP